MESDLEGFLQEQKAKLAKERASLDQDPPYLEMRTRPDVASMKENIPPLQTSSNLLPLNQVKESYGLSLPLGEEYEKKKQKLQQELRQDYRRYMAQEQRGQSKLEKDVAKAVQMRDRDIPSRAPTDTPNPQAPSRRDAATLTEPWARPEGKPRRGLLRHRDERRLRLSRAEEESEQEYSEEELDLLDNRWRRASQDPTYAQKKSRKQYYRPDRDAFMRKDRTDDFDDCSDVDLYVSQPKKENRNMRERRPTETPVVQEEDYSEKQKTLSVTPKPKSRLTEPQRPGRRSRLIASKEPADFATGLMIGAAEGSSALQQKKDRYKQELLEQIAEQERNRRSKMKPQIQPHNSRHTALLTKIGNTEKELELRVAATGAVDPEKKPDRIRQFGAVTREQISRKDVPYRATASSMEVGRDEKRPREERQTHNAEEKPPPERPRVAFQSPLLDYSNAVGGPGAGHSPGNEDFHRSISSTLGDISAPRVTTVPPPQPPSLGDAYKTPYDEAYYYYGARNPLDPNLVYNGIAGVVAHPIAYPIPASVPPTALATAHKGVMPGGTGIGAFLVEKSKPLKETVLSYQEALRQQIQEREEQRRREKEQELYEAKLNAYDPWGRGGGGAPLRDKQGNLIADLKRMHRSNEEANVESPLRDKAVPHVSGNTSITREEQPPTSTTQTSGLAHTSPYARGNVFHNILTPQQINEKDKYKEYLRQQIEEKRRREAEEREQLRLEEEKEERRLVEQRARIQREFNEEQERKKRKEMEQQAKNEELIRQAEERRKEAERKKQHEEEEEAKLEAQRRKQERERLNQLEEIQTRREPSPPIPTLQKRMNGHVRKPPSVASRHPTPALAERPVSTPRSPPVPARRNQLRASEEHRGVLGELSELSRQLRSKQRRLKEKLQQAEGEKPEMGHSDRHRERPPMDVMDLARLRLQTPVRRPSSRNVGPPHHVHDFTHLIDGDSLSNMRMRPLYPDPPSNEHGVDIQQQALQREQRRRMNSLRKRGAADFLNNPQPVPQNPYPRKSIAADPVRSSLLESESAFYDAVSELPAAESSVQRLSARDRRRLSRQVETHNETGMPQELAEQSDTQSLQSEVSVGLEQNRQRLRRLKAHSQHNLLTGPEVSDEDSEELRFTQSTQQSSERRYSAASVATEPWLRPGTSDTVKRLLAEPTQREGLSNRNSLVQHWDGPSTYHG